MLVGCPFLLMSGHRRRIAVTWSWGPGPGHSNDAFWKLGLIRIEGKTNYMLSTRDISTRLELDLFSWTDTWWHCRDDDRWRLHHGPSINAVLLTTKGNPTQQSRKAISEVSHFKWLTLFNQDVWRPNFCPRHSTCSQLTVDSTVCFTMWP